MIVYEQVECDCCHDAYPADQINEGMCEYCQAMSDPRAWEPYPGPYWDSATESWRTVEYRRGLFSGLPARYCA